MISDGIIPGIFPFQDGGNVLSFSQIICLITACFFLHFLLCLGQLPNRNRIKDFAQYWLDQTIFLTINSPELEGSYVVYCMTTLRLLLLQSIIVHHHNSRLYHPYSKAGLLSSGLRSNYSTVTDGYWWSTGSYTPSIMISLKYGYNYAYPNPFS